MKNYLYLLILSFSVASCYTYKVKTESDAAPAAVKTEPIKQEASLRAINDSPARSAAESAKTTRNLRVKQVKPVNKNPANIQEKLEANKYFKIEVGGRPYKIQVDKWESDTLVAHVIHKPKKILKFHKNQINESTIAERHFSQPTADIITVVAYAAIGVGIFALVK